MKKFLLLLIVLASAGAAAQEFATDEILKLSKIVQNSEDPTKRDSAIVEMERLYSSVSEVEKPIVSKLIFTVKDLNTEKKHLVPAKSVSELTKDDLKDFRVNEDKFKEATFIHYKRWGGDTRFVPYISIKNNNLRLRLVTEYKGRDWIFMDKVQFIIDGEKYEYTVYPERDVQSQYVYERDDQTGTDYIINLLYKIANSKNKVEIRMSGKGKYDSYIPDGTKGHLKKILNLYEKLKK